MSGRRWLLAVAFAIALLFAWSAWPPGRAGESDSPTARRPAASSSRAARRPAPVQTRARSAATAPTGTAAPVAAKTGIAACDRFVERSMSCAQLPADAKIAIAEASKAWAQLTAAGSRPDLEASCRATASVHRDALAAMGC